MGSRGAYLIRAQIETRNASGVLELADCSLEIDVVDQEVPLLLPMASIRNMKGVLSSPTGGVQILGNRTIMTRTNNANHFLVAPKRISLHGGDAEIRQRQDRQEQGNAPFSQTIPVEGGSMVNHPQVLLDCVEGGEL